MEVRFKVDFLDWREGQVVSMTMAHAKQLLSLGIVEDAGMAGSQGPRI